ncbi:hypothetical protein PWG15_05485 [Ensifer adhaerens]|uniref:hypothetical protein n=1 Tax=Ensifer adhaerens TaxID=106592 RepID=UPI0023A98C3B|nr:hypothetical protein [Ensifer adhaerens]WDZ77957.1 hypothetical protein PWG15_05485 [Ensifer adhaerens]
MQNNLASGFDASNTKNYKGAVDVYDDLTAVGWVAPLDSSTQAAVDLQINSVFVGTYQASVDRLDVAEFEGRWFSVRFGDLVEPHDLVTICYPGTSIVLANGTFRVPDGAPNNMSEVTREEIDAKIAASEARTDTKFERMMTEFAALRGDLAAITIEMGQVRQSTSGLRSTIVTTAIATVLSLAGLVVAVIALNGQAFSTGMDVRAVVTEVLEQTRQPQSSGGPAKSETPGAQPETP